MKIFVEMNTEIGHILLEWYKKNYRDLPWRRSNDPYLIWLSETILQQTKVAQGLPYFEKFRNTFPTVKNLAEATEEVVLKHWQGLGYYSRARNLHKTAKIVNDLWQGNFPTDFDSLIQLPGIGHYTASAISSIAFEEKRPVLDGNVFRIVSRLFDVRLDIAEAASRKTFLQIAENWMADNKPSLFNQAMMEFGALQCVPQNPSCHKCVLQDHCLALRNGLVNELPVKKKKKAAKEVFLHYLVAEDGDSILMKIRSEKGIWRNMYDFPVVEKATESVLTKEQIAELGWQTDHMVISSSYIHVLTHRKITARFYTGIKPLNNRIAGVQEQWIPYRRMKEIPIPRLIDKFFKHQIG